ncbi:MAG: phosphotransferase family protein [Burkholderiales bacterium]|nr:phosphotransferase family protein [Burkholderiales bacterium]
MALVDHGDPDLVALQERFASWLSRQPGAAGISVAALRQASRTSGFSNETYRLTLREPSGGEQEVILRLPPARTGFFPDYDMARQYTFMDRLFGEPGLAMARCRWLEQDPQPLGRPFFVTDFVAGVVAADQPKYVCEGWIVQASPEQRQRLWDTSIDQLAQLARVRWHGRELAGVDWPDRQVPRLLQHIAYWTRLGDWGASTLPREDDRFLRELAGWLQAHAPRDETAGLVWGDSRFGNIIYQDFKPAALLDWELAVIGDPMIDLAYLLFHVFLTELYHADPAAANPRLTGFRGDEETVMRYCEAVQRSPHDYRYYWLFNAYKMLCIWQCKAALMVRCGVWSVEQALQERRGDRLRAWIARVLESGSEAAYLR